MENKQIEEFNKIKADSLAIVDEVKELTVDGIEDKKGYEALRAGKMRLVRQRTKIKDERLNITRVFDKFKRNVMDMEVEILKVMEPTEKLLAERQQKIDDEKEIINRKKALPKRIERLETIKHEIIESFILEMSDKQFDEYFNIKHAEYLEEKENKIKEEEEKVKREAEILKAKEEARIEAEKKAEQARKDAIEVEKLKAEREKQAIIDKHKAEEEARLNLIEIEEATKRENEAKEKAEKEKLEKRKKYTNWLEKNGYTEKTKDQFYIINKDNKFTIYKKLDEVTIN